MSQAHSSFNNDFGHAGFKHHRDLGFLQLSPGLFVRAAQSSIGPNWVKIKVEVGQMKQIETTSSARVNYS